MRNKELIEVKLDRLITMIKNIGYLVGRNEKDLAYEEVGKTIDFVETIQSLVSLETQD